jgi:hypothetical protein
MNCLWGCWVLLLAALTFNYYDDNSFHNNRGQFSAWITPCWLFLFLAVICRLFHCSLVPLKPEEITRANSTLFILPGWQPILSLKNTLGDKNEDWQWWITYPLVWASFAWQTLKLHLQLRGTFVWPSASVCLTRGRYCWRFGRGRVF